MTVLVYYNSMRMTLTSSSGVPIYRQITDQIAYAVACRRLQAGDKLPSVRELARSLPANQNTVLKAYELLERDGLIERRQGDGTYVTGNGSPLKRAERRRRVREMMDNVVAQATHLEIQPDELHRMLDEQLERLTHREETTNE